MFSLSEIATRKIVSMATCKQLGNGSGNIFDVSEKMPKELLVKIVDETQKELVKTKKELIEAKEFHGICTKKEELQMVEEAHKYGFCKEKYEGRCHLCGDERCVLCWSHLPLNIAPFPCSHCHMRKMKEVIVELKKSLETCEGECTGFLCSSCKDCICGQIMHLECSIVEHKNGVCNCFGTHHELLY